MVLVLLSTDSSSNYSLSIPRKLTPFLDAATFRATMSGFNSLNTQVSWCQTIQFTFAMCIMVLFCFVPLIRGPGHTGSENGADWIDGICIGIGLIIGFSWMSLIAYYSYKQEERRKQQLEHLVNQVDEQYEQLAIATGRPRICWSMANLLGEKDSQSSMAKYIQIEICCTHLMQHMNQSQSQQQQAHPQLYPQLHDHHQQHNLHHSADIEMSLTSSPSRSVYSQPPSSLTSTYPDLENPLLQ